MHPAMHTAILKITIPFAVTRSAFAVSAKERLRGFGPFDDDFDPFEDDEETDILLPLE